MRPSKVLRKLKSRLDQTPPMQGGNRRFPNHLRSEVKAAIADLGIPVDVAAKQLGIAQSTIWKWRRAAANAPTRGKFNEVVVEPHREVHDSADSTSELRLLTTAGVQVHSLRLKDVLAIMRELGA